MSRKYDIATAVIAMIALVWLALPAAAQVATPSIDPTAFGVTALNPAVLQWSAPSRGGAGYISGKNQSDSTGANKAELSGPYFNFAMVGEDFSAGAEFLKLSIKPAAGGAYDYNQAQVALAGQMGGWFALGVGQDKIYRSDGADNRQLPIYGASMVLGETFFIGLARGTETATTPTVESTRQVNRWGVGFRTSGKGGAVRVEYNVTESDALNFSGTIQEQATDEIGVIEYLNGVFLIGARWRWIETFNETAGQTVREKRMGYSIGMVPMGGWAVVAFVDDRERVNKATAVTQDRWRYRLGIANQF